MKKLLYVIALLLLSSTLFSKNFYQYHKKPSYLLSFFGGGGFSISEIALDDEKDNSDPFYKSDNSKTIGTSHDLFFGVAAYFFYEDFVLSAKIEREYRKFSDLKYDDEEVDLKNSFTSFSLGIGSSYNDDSNMYLFSIGLQYSIASSDTISANFASGHSELLKSKDIYSVFFETAFFTSPIYSAIELKLNLNNPYKSNSADYPLPNMIELLFSFKIGIYF